MDTMWRRFMRILIGMVVLAIISTGCETAKGGDRFTELAEQPFVERAATDAAAKTLMEELYFQRACQVYMWAMPAMNTVGMGAKYPSTFRDADSDLLSGGKTYKLRLPAGIPAKLFWSVTVYDGDNASGLDNGQPLPSINSMDRPKENADGSIDIYFGPEITKGVDNWLRTVPGKSWFILLRLHGPESRISTTLGSQTISLS